MPRTGGEVHPLAWWLWALGLAVAGSRTTNPLLLLLVVAVAGYVVAARRPPGDWAGGFRAYLVFGLVVVGIRTGFHIIFGGGQGQTVLLRLPEIGLPEWAAGIRLGGAVSAEGLVSALYDGLRLATLLICVGAAVTLAAPRRLLRTLPGALYELGLIVVVAVSLAPQLVEAAVRVRRARSLRGTAGRGLGALRSILMPVLAMALDRAVALAAAMDARGYGRAGAAAPLTRRATSGLLLVGLCGVCLGSYGLLDTSVPGAVGLPALLVGAGCAAAGLFLGSRRTTRSRYRAEGMDLRSVLVAASGVLAAVALVATSSGGWYWFPGGDRLDVAFASTYPVLLPRLSPLPLIGLALALAPAWLAPPPPRPEPPPSAAVPRESVGSSSR